MKIFFIGLIIGIIIPMIGYFLLRNRKENQRISDVKDLPKVKTALNIIERTKEKNKENIKKKNVKDTVSEVISKEQRQEDVKESVNNAINKASKFKRSSP